MFWHQNKGNVRCSFHSTLYPQLVLVAPRCVTLCVCGPCYPWSLSCRLRLQMKMELESTCVILRGFDGLQCHVELLSAGCSSSEQFPFIHFINTLSSVTSSWLENTQTLKHTNTHTIPESCSTTSVLRKPPCFAASDYRPPAPPFKIITNYWSSKKKDKKKEKAPLTVPMATALLFSFSAQSIRQWLSGCPAPTRL